MSTRRRREEREQGEDDGERGIDRTHDGLRQAVVDDAFERGIGLPGKVLANAVEDDNRVVHREADDRQDRRYKERIDLDIEKANQESKKPQAPATRRAACR